MKPKKEKSIKELEEDIKKLELELKKQELLDKIERLKRKGVTVTYIGIDSTLNKPSMLFNFFNKNKNES